jgi:hypothetical protein
MDLGNRRDKLLERADDVEARSKQLKEVTDLPSWRRFLAWRDLRDSQKGTLAAVLEAQKGIKSTGTDIGRFRGTIPATTDPIPTPFDPMARTLSGISGVKISPKDINLMDTHFPGLEELQKRMTPTVPPTPARPPIWSSPPKPPKPPSTTPLLR